MSAAAISPQDSISTGRYRLTLAAIFLAFLAFRLPIIYLGPGGIDEEWYAVPGLTILQDGIPRLPMFPSRNPNSLPYYADQCVYFMPPLYFYLSAAFYAILPHLYGTARLVSLTAAVVMLGVVCDLARRWTGSRLAVLWSVGLLSMTRIFFIPATIARPDILCGMFGLVAVWTTNRWVETRRRRWLTATGILIGLGGLTHPYAVAYALQIGVWVLWESRGWRKLVEPAYVALLSMAVLALWIPLILRNPEIFRVQFHNQFLTTAASQSVFLRLINPWPSFVFHSKYMFDHMTIWQSILLFLPMTACTIYAFRNRVSGLRRACVLAWSALYLICTTTGPHHLTWNYFVYPAALAAVCTGWTVAFCGKLLVQRKLHVLAWIGGVALIMSMIPGSYARVLRACVLNWNDVNYNAPKFAQMLLKEIPEDAICVVDKEVLLDFFVAGRKVLSAQTDPTYFSAERFPYDYFLCGDHGRLYQLVPQMCCEKVRDYGEQQDPLGIFMTLYQPSHEPCVKTTVTPFDADAKAPTAVPDERTLGPGERVE